MTCFASTYRSVLRCAGCGHGNGMDPQTACGGIRIQRSGFRLSRVSPSVLLDVTLHSDQSRLRSATPVGAPEGAAHSRDSLVRSCSNPAVLFSHPPTPPSPRPPNHHAASFFTLGRSTTQINSPILRSHARSVGTTIRTKFSLR